jgi:hypothetical protein
VRSTSSVVWLNGMPLGTKCHQVYLCHPGMHSSSVLHLVAAVSLDETGVHLCTCRHGMLKCAVAYRCALCVIHPSCSSKFGCRKTGERFVHTFLLHTKENLANETKFLHIDVACKVVHVPSKTHPCMLVCCSGEHGWQI